MMPPGQAPGGAPQISPQMAQQMIAQRMQGGGAPQPAQAMPPGMAPFAAAAGPPGGAPVAPPGGASQGPTPMTAQQMASAGRLGDSVIAHLTPGEITIPPEIQTPQVMAALKKAFASAGVPPQQFVAGSPSSSVNPATGAEEHSLWSAILPVVGGIAGSFIPGIGTAAGAALGGGLGGLAGGAIDHTSPLGMLAGAAGGAAGGYLSGGGLSSLMGGAAPAAGAATSAPATMAGSGANPFGPGLGPELGGLSAGAQAGVNGVPGIAQAASAAPTLGLMDRLKMGMGAGLGAGLGSSLAPAPTQDTAAGLPPGFNDHMPPVNQDFNAARGSTQSSTPSFAGYNPYAAVSGTPFNFYPVVR